MSSESLPISIKNITKTYGDVFALNNVSLEVKSGEFLTLLGPSGSGKTTLLMVLAGFTRPDSGNLYFGEKDVIRTAPHLRNVGMTFQSYALFPHMSVAGNVGYPLKLRKVPKKQREIEIKKALQTVQLEGFGERRIHQLSGGQKQRVALARSIVFTPRILLMDEPLSALDKKLREQMQIELRQLHENLGMTTVYVTHDQREALTMSDRIAVVNHGRIMQIASPRTLYERPANKFVADFIGESTFLEVAKKGNGIFYETMELKTEHSIPPAEKLLLLVRPERIKIVTENTNENANIFNATMGDIVYQGDTYLLYAKLSNGTELNLRGSIKSGTLESLPQKNEKIKLGLLPQDTVIIDGAEH